MKKILLSIVFSFSMLVTVFAQTDLEKKEMQKQELQTMVSAQGPISNIPKCFCCGEFYQLVPPVISGPSIANCGTTVKFTWPNNCQGVIVGRNFSPFPPGAIGGGDNVSGYLNIPAGYTGTITLTVTFACGNKTVTSQKVFKVDCCDCSKLPKQFNITGPASLCKSANCNDLLTYTAPELGNSACFSHRWSINPSVPTGSSGNQLLIKCGVLNAGTTYTITDSIWCGNQSYVVSTKKLEVCKKEDPNFIATINTFNNTVTFSSPVGCYHKWYFFEDVNGNEQHDSGDGIVYGQVGNTVTFSVIPGKHYGIHHYVECRCGPAGEVCRTLKEGYFLYSPSTFKQNPADGKNILQMSNSKEVIVDKTVEEKLLQLEKQAKTQKN